MEPDGSSCEIAEDITFATLVIFPIVTLLLLKVYHCQRKNTTMDYDDDPDQDSHECETMVRTVGEMCRDLSRLRPNPVFTKYNL